MTTMIRQHQSFFFKTDFYELSLWSPAISRLSPTVAEQPRLQKLRGIR